MVEESKLIHVSPTRQNTCSQPPPRCSSNDKAKDRDAQQARMELHLRSQAWRALARMAGGFMPDLRLRQLAQKVLALTRPSASDFAGKNHQPGTAVGAGKFRVRGLLASSRPHERRSIHPCALWAWPANTPYWRHQGGVDGQLRDPSATTSRRLCSWAPRGGKSRSLTHTLSVTPAHSRSTLECKSSPTQNTRSRTRRPVVAKVVEQTATPACGRGQLERAPEAPKQQHPERLCVKIHRQSQPRGAHG